jgi:hypothetical protein
LRESAWDKVKNKNNESTKPVSINFDIVVDSSGWGKRLRVDR